MCQCAEGGAYIWVPLIRFCQDDFHPLCRALHPIPQAAAAAGSQRLRKFRLQKFRLQIVRDGEMGQMEWNRVLLLVALLVTATAVPGAEANGRGHRKGSVLKGVNLSFPPFTSALNCSYDGSVGVGPEFICTPSATPPPEIAFSFDDAVVSVRYAYNKKVQLYKKNSPYAVSFSTSYVIKFQRGSDLVESEIFRLFGGGFAFAITPNQNVGKSDRESLGLFEIDTATGNALHPKKSKTIAVEIDTSREFDWDPTIPHLGLDLNSVHSVVDTYLGDVEHFVDRRIAVFIDYDARREFLAVRLQFLADAEKPNKKYAKLRLSYHGLKLSDYVNEKSIVGFSARVPQTESGTYDLTEWKFKTSWVRTSKWH